MKYTYSSDDAKFRREIEQEGMHLVKELHDVIELTLHEALEYAKSYTSETVPHPKGGSRKLHPGGWGDVTNNLRNSMQVEVKVGSKMQISGKLFTIMEYAEELEAREGLEVFGGFDKTAREALRKYAKRYGLRVTG